MPPERCMDWAEKESVSYTHLMFRCVWNFRGQDTGGELQRSIKRGIPVSYTHLDVYKRQLQALDKK